MLESSLFSHFHNLTVLFPAERTIVESDEKQQLKT